MSDERPNLVAIDRATAIIAHEAIVNLLVNDWSNMSRDALASAEGVLAEGLERDPEFGGAEALPDDSGFKDIEPTDQTAIGTIGDTNVFVAAIGPKSGWCADVCASRFESQFESIRRQVEDKEDV